LSEPQSGYFSAETVERPGDIAAVASAGRAGEAEGAGFEPAVVLARCRVSKPIQSAALPPLRVRLGRRFLVSRTPSRFSPCQSNQEENEIPVRDSRRRIPWHASCTIVPGSAPNTNTKEHLMSNTANIRQGMDVVGSDTGYVGVVETIEGS